MSQRQLQEPVRGIVLDIEGTTTPIDFVYQTLFPYARARMAEYLAAHYQTPAVQTDLAGLRVEHAADLAQGQAPPPLDETSTERWLTTATAYLLWLMERDRKTTPLKSLQGKIWEAGYLTGELKSAMYEDVPPALARWQAQGKQIAIYSSGSVLAQQLLFKHTEAGDLTGYLSGYFDTQTGAKRAAASYTRIAAALALEPAAILFCSDVTAELAAARAAGWQTVLLLRPGNPPQPAAEEFSAVTSFTEL